MTRAKQCYSPVTGERWEEPELPFPEGAAGVSLSEFARRQEDVPSACWACSLPELYELTEAREMGVQVTVMARWLIHERGYDVPVDKLRQRLSRHFNGGHVARVA